MKTVSNVLLYCENIETIIDLEGWIKVYQSDIEVIKSLCKCIDISEVSISQELEIHMKNCNVNIKLRESGRDSRWLQYLYLLKVFLNQFLYRYVSLYQICQTALKEKFPRVEGWEGEQWISLSISWKYIYLVY